ncbi:NnrU family protein [Tianweitania sediminis]|uniref:NnrU family protein n=1 Tax=Tianweitania sediminis TaxID=1502156 RepID=A0A8J7UIB8_9HYPH|nr:NnrU family protein [Tianweitania sediminis]MBP0438738.1 NnrU family protein [Tianweitania sediminis]
MTVLILGIILFLGIHSTRIAAPAWRDRQVQRMGDGGWKGVYSLVSFVGLMLMIWGYGLARNEGVVLYEPPSGLKHASLLLMLLAFVAFAAYLFPAGHLKARLKHPMLVAVKLWAVAHLLANGDLASLLLFGSFLVWAVLDRISVKRRAVPTPLPGPVKWDLIAVGFAVVVYLLFLWRLHVWLVGVYPLPQLAG